jgi:tetratricopeptide (TPR) repeat protein
MMDIPFVRFSFPLLILYLIYRAIVVEPYIPEVAEEETSATLNAKETRRLLAEARDLQAANRFPEAIVPLSRLYTMNPENHLYIQQLAEIYHRLENYPREVQMWEQFLIHAPLPIEGCPQIGQAYLSQGLRKEATHAFERCLAIDEQNSDSLFFFGHALETEGQFERAAALYRRGLKTSPHYPDLILGLARIQVRRGELAEARRAVQGVLQRSPDTVDALLVAGLIAWRSGETAQAKRYLERGMLIEPSYQDLRVILNHVLRQEREQRKSGVKSPGPGSLTAPSVSAGDLRNAGNGIAPSVSAGDPPHKSGVKSSSPGSRL